MQGGDELDKAAHALGCTLELMYQENRTFLDVSKIVIKIDHYSDDTNALDSHQ